MNSNRRISAAVALLAGAGLALSACSSSGGRQENSGATGGAAAPEKTMTVAFVTHAAAGDTFWDLVRKGAEDAAAKDGVTLE